MEIPSTSATNINLTRDFCNPIHKANWHIIFDRVFTEPEKSRIPGISWNFKVVPEKPGKA